MDAEMKEMFELLLGKMDGLQREVKKVSQDVIITNIKIENDVAQRIEGLFDGYKLTHEKQWELERAFERKTAELQMQIDVLQARLDKLESA